MTRYRKAKRGLLSKNIGLGEDGQLVSDGSACSMCAGTAMRVEITRGASGLADLISDLDSCEALGLGNHVAEQDEIDLVLDKHADPSRGLYSRTVRFFTFEPGKPAVVLLDFDQKGMPPKVAALLEAMGGFEAAVSMLLEGDFGSFARVIRKSTSAGIYNRETGERFRTGGGQHLYVLVRDGSDIPRFLRALQARAWKAGLGWIMIGKRGARLIRSIIDVSVGSPERLVFEGKPLVKAPLAQDQEERRPIAHDGDLIDTRIACPDLTEAEETEFNRSVEAAKVELQPEVEKAVVAAAEGLAKKHSISVERAREVIEASTRGELLSWDSVHFDDDALGVVSVADILADPERYHGETLADPVEGRDYGTCKGKVFYNRGGSVIINSFAHGGGTYTLKHCPEYVALKVEEAGEDAPNVLAKLAPFMGGIDAVTRERLRNLAAKFGKVNKRTVSEVLKQAQAKARLEEKEHRVRNAPRSDGKQKVDARERLDLVGGERPVVLRKIEATLRRTDRVGPGSVLARGQTQVVLRIAAEPVKIKGGGEEAALPAGSVYLVPSKPEHLQAQLDRTIAFYKFDKDGEEYATDCPGDLARYVLPNASLLPIMAISRTPLLRDDGSVIETPGYDPATAIYYAPDELFPPIPDRPTQEDAKVALNQLIEPFRGFPCVEKVDRHCMAGEVLTLLTRHLVALVPAFVHDAVEAGSGKTKSFNTVSTIVTGAPAPTLNAEVMRDETEQRKLLTTLTLTATPFAVFDNTARGEHLTSPGLANFLTAEIYGDRRLGANEEVKAPTCTTIGVTGNGIEIAGDLTRRMLKVSLDAGCERPETRPFDFDSQVEAKENRGALVVAALTILKAHALAGRPRVQGRAPLGSYEAWDRLVAGAIVFAGGEDIVGLMDKNRKADPERDNLYEVMAMLEGVGAVTGSSKKAGEIIAAVRQMMGSLQPTEEAQAWFAIIQRLGKDGSPDPRRLGRFLKKNAGRHVHGRQLVTSFDQHAKVERYYVAETADDLRGKRGMRGSPDLNPESWEKEREEVESPFNGFTQDGYGTDPANPANPADDVEADDGPWEAEI